MHVIRMIVPLIVLACFALYATGEIIHYRPEYSAKKVIKGEDRGNKACFLDSFWDTTGTRTLLTVSGEPNPYWGCLNESSHKEILGKMFQLHRFNRAEEKAVNTGLMDALLLIHNGEEVMHTMNQTGIFTRSYLRYFDPKDFDVVHRTITWLSRHLGKPPREGFQDFRNVLQALPLPVYRWEREETPVCMSGALAYMSSSPSWSAMSLCNNWNWRSKAWSLASIKCRVVGRSLTDLNTHYWQSLGFTLTHELFHWGILTETIPGRVIVGDRVLNSSAAGGPCVAYGPWASQELRRVEPWKAVTNADSYAIFLAEELLQRRCRTMNGFSDSPYKGPGIMAGLAKIASDKEIYPDKHEEKENDKIQKNDQRSNDSDGRYAININWYKLIFGLCLIPGFLYVLRFAVFSGAASARARVREEDPYGVKAVLSASGLRKLRVVRAGEYLYYADGSIVKVPDARLPQR